MSNFTNIRESIREAKASYDVGEHRIGALHLDEALEEVSELERQSQTTYELSKDYEALYEHLIGGGETLGRRRHSESSPRFPLFIAEDIRPMHVPLWHSLVKSGETRFVSECQKMGLEFVAPVHPSPDTQKLVNAGNGLVSALWAQAEKDPEDNDTYVLPMTHQAAIERWNAARHPTNPNPKDNGE